MTFTHKSRLYQVLLRWFIIIGLLSVSLGLGSYLLFSYESVRSYAVSSIIETRDQQVIMLERWFGEKQRTIVQFTLSSTLKEKNIDCIKRAYEEYLVGTDTDFESLFFADTTGKVLVDAKDINPLLYVGDRSFFQASMKGEKFISEVLISRKDGRPVITVSCPVYSEDNEIIGVAFGGLNLSKISEFIAPFNYGKSGETFLVDKRGVMLTESHFTQELIKKGLIKASTQYQYIVNSPGVTNVVSGLDGFQEYLNHRGKNVAAAYKWLPKYNWGFIVEVDKEEIIGNWLSQVLIIFSVIFLIMLLVITPLAKYLAGKIVAPLTNLTQRLELFTLNYKSDVLSWTALDSYLYQEIEMLSQSFYTMGEKLGQLMDNLETQAQHDALTGIPNRHYFFKRSMQIIDLTERNKRMCSLIFIDIDKFKGINDTYRHSAGDAILIHMAKLLEKSIRFSDVVGRFGGDEFTVILPDTDFKGARYFAERIRLKIENTPVLIEGNEIFITASMGVAVYCGENKRINRQEVLEDLINRADMAMYRAKRKSRNRVEYDFEFQDERQLKIFINDEGGDVQ